MSDVSIEYAGKRIDTSDKQMKKALQVFDADERLAEIANEILQIQSHRKELNELITQKLGEAENLGIPKKAFRLAIALIEEDGGKVEMFDKGLFRARKAIGIPMQLELF